jgi:hypothetical protein
VPITLVSPGLASGVSLDAADLNRLDEGHGPIKLITPPARAWLQAVGGAGASSAFAVPSMLAVDVAAHPGEVRCEAAVATVAGPKGPRLLVTSSGPGRKVTWCHTADPGAKARIISDVLRVQPLAR